MFRRSCRLGGAKAVRLDRRADSKMLVYRELVDHDADELIVTDTMWERKQIMEDRSDAFIVLPGGVGTPDS